MTESRRRGKVLVVLGAVVACLAVAGVVVPAKLVGSSQIPTVAVLGAAPATPGESGSIAARELGGLLRAPGPETPESRPISAAGLFFWAEELASGKSIGELWKEEDARPPTPSGRPEEAPASRPKVSPEDMARAQAIVVRGIVVGSNGSWAVLSTGRARPNDRIPGLPFRVESIEPKSVTLIAEGQRVVLEVAASRSGRVRTVAK